MTCSIYLLRHPRIEWNGSEILTDLNSKARALIFYVAGQKERVVSRDALADVFWPELTVEKSRGNLRQTLSMIKKASLCAGLSTSVILTDKGICRLDPQLNPMVDADVFYRSVEQGCERNGEAEGQIRLLQQAVDLYEDGFLNGFYVRGSVELDEWLMYERENLGQTLAAGCRRLAELYEERDDRESAIRCFTKLLKTNPLQEEVHRELMRLHYENRDRGKAIRQYQQCVKLLRSELNVGPMEETRKLYEEITNDRTVLSRDSDDESEFTTPLTAPMKRFAGHYLFSAGDRSVETLAEQTRENWTGVRCLRIGKKAFPRSAYEGVYELLEPLLPEIPVELEKEFSGLFPQLSGGDGPSSGGLPAGGGTSNGSLSETRLFYAAALLLENISADRGLAVLLEQYELLDSETQRMIGFLLNRFDSGKETITFIIICEAAAADELLPGFR